MAAGVPGERQARPERRPLRPGAARAGLPVGTGRVVDAIRAVEAVGFGDREDFYDTLARLLRRRPEHRAVFAQTFRLFWRDPRSSSR